MAQRSSQGPVDPGGPGVPGGARIVKDAQNPLQFGTDPRKSTTFIDPRIADPAALKYAMGAEARRRTSGLSKQGQPVAGGPDVKIPNLNEAPIPGLTMAEQARYQRGEQMPGAPTAPDLSGLIGGMQQTALSQGIIGGTDHYKPPAEAQPKNAAGASLEGLLRTDMLPEAAQQDQTFQQGGGSMYAVNQPHLAKKYGVMRNGQHIPAQALAGQQQRAAQIKAGAAGVPAKPVLTSGTLEGLAAIEEFNRKRAQVESPDSDARIEASAKAGPAGGGSSQSAPLSAAESKEFLDEMDSFDLSRTRNAMLKDLLNNDDQRGIIESRLKPLDLTDLIMSGRVRQRVPIVPGVFEPTFQSYSSSEDLFIKRTIGAEVRSNEATDQYALDKYTVMGLTVAVYAIGNTVLPDYRNEKGLLDEDAFWAKYAVVSSFNYHMISSLAANWFWFDIRVRKLYKAETLGNG